MLTNRDLRLSFVDYMALYHAFSTNRDPRFCEPNLRFSDISRVLSFTEFVALGRELDILPRLRAWGYNNLADAAQAGYDDCLRRYQQGESKPTIIVSVS